MLPFRNALLYLFALNMLLLGGCKKDAAKPVDILLSKAWHRGMVDRNPATTPQFSYPQSGSFSYAAVMPCDLDDTYQFRTDGTLLITRNSNQCVPNELPTQVLPYSIDRTAKTLTIAGITYKLAEESTTQIKYYINFPTGSNLTTNYLGFLLQ